MASFQLHFVMQLFSQFLRVPKIQPSLPTTMELPSRLFWFWQKCSLQHSSLTTFDKSDHGTQLKVSKRFANLMNTFLGSPFISKSAIISCVAQYFTSNDTSIIMPRKKWYFYWLRIVYKTMDSLSLQWQIGCSHRSSMHLVAQWSHLWRDALTTMPFGL